MDISEKPLPPPPRVQSFVRQASILVDKTQGYHFGVIWCAAASGSVCLTNALLTLWGSKTFDVIGGLGIIQQGSCSQTKNLATWLHLAINVLSTLLLGASNYTMQCLSSPTRKEIDKAHSRRQWLDVGIPSARNVARISWSRRFLWWTLALTSIPLHLMWNSAVFTTLSTRAYSIFTVTHGFLDGDPYQIPYLNSTNRFGFGDVANAQRVRAQEKMESLKDPQIKWKKMSNAQCIQAYGTPLVSKYGSVLLVSSHEDPQNSVLVWYGPKMFDQVGYNSPFNWICNRKQSNGSDNDNQWAKKYCDVTKLGNPKDWTNGGYPIDHCLSIPVEEHCQVQFSIAIMVTVICCNFIKFLVMGYLAWKQPTAPLVTLGDAVASFLNRPDLSTAGGCLNGIKDFNNPYDWKPKTLAWRQKKHIWFHAASTKQWLLSHFLFFSTMVCVGALLSLGVSSRALQDKSISHIWNLGFGNVTSESLLILGLQGSSGLVQTVLLANSPQVLLSFLYLLYNNLFTSMLLAKEWTGYAHQRKGLRVTNPKGLQRSTYFLQLPYTYSVPLLTASGLMHWLVSQSIFLARVTAYDEAGVEDPEKSISTCGYSNIAIIFDIIFGCLLIFIGLAHGLRRYKPGIPLVGSCSAAISAACHPPETDVGVAEKTLQWGALTGKQIEMDDGFIGHCCLTSFEVQPPEEGKLYAGLTSYQNGALRRRSVVDS